MATWGFGWFPGQCPVCATCAAPSCATQSPHTRWRPSPYHAGSWSSSPTETSRTTQKHDLTAPQMRRNSDFWNGWRECFWTPFVMHLSWWMHWLANDGTVKGGELIICLVYKCIKSWWECCQTEMMGLFRTLSGVDTLWFTQNQSCLISYLSKEISQDVKMEIHLDAIS